MEKSQTDTHGAGEHISLSPPRSSTDSGHISLSPPRGSNRNSPARSSIESDRHISINLSHGGSSPETGDPRSPEGKPPPAVVRKDVFMEPKEHMVVFEEPAAVVVSRVVLEEPKAPAPKASKPDPVAGGGGGGIGRRRFTPSLSILKRAKRDKMVKQAGLGFRVFGFLFCLVALSVMAADRHQGWAIDSFYSYKEFRYCISVNAIGFVYSAAQALDMLYNLATGTYIGHRQHQRLRHYFDFALDQMIAYLLISASSSAVIRVEDWQSNWGKDKFPDMATASISVSFLAFIALAMSSLISGYTLCTSKSL